MNRGIETLVGYWRDIADDIDEWFEANERGESVCWIFGRAR